MNQFTTQIVDALMKNRDITEVFYSHLEIAINLLLATELTEFWIMKNTTVLVLTQAISRNGEFKQ